MDPLHVETVSAARIRVSYTVYEGGEGGGIPPLEKIPYVVKLHPPPLKLHLM